MRRGWQQRVHRHKFGWVSGVFHSTKSSKPIRYKSRLELMVCRYLDDNPRVATYYYEAVKLPYVVSLDGKALRRNYLPDFIIQFTDNTREMWEVKPLRETTNPINVGKFKSGYAFCKKYGIQFRILTESTIANLLRGV